MARPSTPGSAACSRCHGRRQQGFTYIGILIAVIIIGLMMTTVGRVWATTERREKEAQLLWVGHQYRAAIAAYFANGHQYPLSLQLLLADDRSPVAKRYLRRLYPDPMTGQADWTLIYASDGVGIMGVASTSQLQPLKRKGFDALDGAFEDKECYCDWQFEYVPRRFYIPGGGHR